MLTPTLTRDQLAATYTATHPELGQLLQRKIAPLPVRVDGVALWFADEAAKAKPAVDKFLKHYRERRARR